MRKLLVRRIVEGRVDHSLQSLDVLIPVFHVAAEQHLLQRQRRRGVRQLEQHAWVGIESDEERRYLHAVALG
jgi:hypothetical protein